MQPLLSIAGLLDAPRSLTFEDLAAIPAERQIVDVGRIEPGRKGDAEKLAGILSLVKPKNAAQRLRLHAAKDDFHANIPLDAVSDKTHVIYRLAGQPQPASATSLPASSLMHQAATTAARSPSATVTAYGIPAAFNAEVERGNRSRTLATARSMRSRMSHGIVITPAMTPS
jgi:hypothetical protein